MILISTHEKLVAKDAVIYRVDWPKTDAVKLGLSDACNIPASHEHFAVLSAAKRQVNRYAPFAVGTITAVAASKFNPFQDI